MTVGQEKIFIKHCALIWLQMHNSFVFRFGMQVSSSLSSSFSTALSHVAIWISYGVQFHTKILWVSLKQNRQNKTEKMHLFHTIQKSIKGFFFALKLWFFKMTKKQYSNRETWCTSRSKNKRFEFLLRATNFNWNSTWLSMYVPIGFPN